MDCRGTGHFCEQGQYTPWWPKDPGSSLPMAQHTGRRLCVAFHSLASPGWSAGYERERKLLGVVLWEHQKWRIELGMARVDMRHGDRTIECIFWKGKEGIVLGLLERGSLSFRFSTTAVMIVVPWALLSGASTHLMLCLHLCLRSHISRRPSSTFWSG